MRKGMQGLSLLVQGSLGRDPFAEDVFVFRGRGGSLIKALWHAVPIGPIHRFGFPGSIRRHFERLDSFPLPIRRSLCLERAHCSRIGFTERPHENQTPTKFRG
jgi:hypothetical protein